MPTNLTEKTPLLTKKILLSKLKYVNIIKEQILPYPPSISEN